MNARTRISLAVLLAIVATTFVTTGSVFAADSAWKARYWNNTSLSGTPTLVRYENAINYDWGEGRPASGINKDNFSARWTRLVTFSAGTYRFTATSDDGMRVWVDDRLIVDMWYEHAPVTKTVDVKLSGGDHRIKVEYFERAGGALARLSWGPKPAASYNSWKGQYFNNTSLSGSPVLVRDDPAINFNWGEGSPAKGIVNKDSFSVRWKRTVWFDKGTYRFTATSDDGMRVWVDDALIIDQWYNHPEQTVIADVKLSAGEHRIKVEYYDAGVHAVARLSWARR